jgi:hypothetical protein
MRPGYSSREDTLFNPERRLWTAHQTGPFNRQARQAGTSIWPAPAHRPDGGVSIESAAHVRGGARNMRLRGGTAYNCSKRERGPIRTTLVRVHFLHSLHVSKARPFLSAHPLRINMQPSRTKGEGSFQTKTPFADCASDWPFDRHIRTARPIGLPKPICPTACVGFGRAAHARGLVNNMV